MRMKFSVLIFLFVDDEPGMSFGPGSDCPQASQMCCDTCGHQRVYKCLLICTKNKVLTNHIYKLTVNVIFRRGNRRLMRPFTSKWKSQVFLLVPGLWYLSGLLLWSVLSLSVLIGAFWVFKKLNGRVAVDHIQIFGI